MTIELSLEGVLDMHGNDNPNNDISEVSTSNNGTLYSGLSSLSIRNTYEQSSCIYIFNKKYISI